MKSAPAIAFEYRPSRWVVVAIVAAAMLAIAALALSGIALWLKLITGCAAVACTVHALRRFLRPPVRRVAWHEAGHWRLSDASNTEHVAELQRAVVRGDWLVLNLRRTDGMRIPLILGPDNCDADTCRRLRVRLARADAGLATV